MANSWPYATEKTHVQGTVTQDSSNAARSTATSSTEGRLKVDIANKIFLLETNKHPLVSLLTNIGKVKDGDSWKGMGILKQPTGNPEFSWLEDLYGGRYAKNSGTYAASGALTITVTGAGSQPAYLFTVGDIIRNARTGENMLVATIASTTTITVASAGRSFGTTAAAAGADGDGLYKIGNVNEENSGARNVNTTQSSKESNYTQIFKTSIAVSGTQEKSDLYGGNDLTYQRTKKGTEHALEIERAFWLGEKKYDTGGTMGHPRRATGGILEFIEGGNSYVQNQGGILTAPDFNTFLREGFTYGNRQKVFVCGGLVLQAINEIARDQIRMKPLAKTYGIQIGEYVHAQGVINIIHNPHVFVEDYAGYGFLLDMECFKYRYMKDRDTKLYTNVQAPDVDGVVDQYVTECGLQRVHPAKCALLKGVQA